MNSFSLHENSIRRFSFFPEDARLVVEMDDPIVGASGERVIVFRDVSYIQVTGSTTGGSVGYIPSDEVLTLNLVTEEGTSCEGVRARFILLPIPSFVRQGSGTSIVEVMAGSFELAPRIEGDDSNR